MSFFGGRRNQQPEPTPEPHQERAASPYHAPTPTNPTVSSALTRAMRGPDSQRAGTR